MLDAHDSFQSRSYIALVIVPLFIASFKVKNKLKFTHISLILVMYLINIDYVLILLKNNWHSVYVTGALTVSVVSSSYIINKFEMIVYFVAIFILYAFARTILIMV